MMVTKTRVILVKEIIGLLKDTDSTSIGFKERALTLRKELGEGMEKRIKNLKVQSF